MPDSEKLVPYWTDTTTGITWSGSALDEFIEELRTHKHEYTIPVDWKYDVDDFMGGDYAPSAQLQTAMHVTKLRCSCGEEINR